MLRKEIKRARRCSTATCPKLNSGGPISMKFSGLFGKKSSRAEKTEWLF